MQFRKIIIIILFGFIVFMPGFCKSKINLKEYPKGIYVVKVDSNYFAQNSSIYLSKDLKTVEQAARKSRAKVAINAGFFDPNNAKTISYILKNNKIIADPRGNERLINNDELKPHLEKIFNRSEFRVYSNCFEIKPHNAPILRNNLKYSVQAGPELVPDYNVEKEYFGKLAGSKVARSAIAIKGNEILLIAARNLTLNELTEFLKTLKVEQGMAFDGGSSTSLYVDLPGKKLNLNSTKDNTARRVKSVLILK